MPTISLGDRATITKIITSGELFPLITDREERRILCNRLLRVPGRILSLQTLVDDTCYLDYPAKILRTLLPLGFKGSIETAFSSCHSLPTPNRMEIQTSEYKFKLVDATRHAAAVGLIQLWLFALRHFVHPATDSNFGWSGPQHIIEVRSKTRMALLASRLGFTTDQIEELASKDTDSATSTHILETICREEFYMPNNKEIQTMTHLIKNLLRSLGKQTIQSHKTPTIATNDPDESGRRRQNRPLAGEHYKDRHWLFFEYIFGGLQHSTAQYPTSFAVTRDIIFCFFRRDVFLNLIGGQNASTTETGQTLSSSSNTETLSDFNSSPVELLPHPSGTPDRDYMSGVEYELPPVSTADDRHKVSQAAGAEATTIEDGHEASRGTGAGATTVEDGHEAHQGAGADTVMEEAEPTAPLAAGFEIEPAPLGRLNHITLHRDVRAILHQWYRSANTHLIILFLFESRAYYKFRTSENYALRGTLLDLSREHYFLVVGHNGEMQSPANIYEETLKARLVFVGKKDHPTNEEHGATNSRITVDSLRRYASNYDVRTGKRKRQQQESIEEVESE